MNRNPQEPHVQRAGNLPAAYVGDSLLMMSTEMGQYFCLNGVGARIWDLLEQPIAPAALVERLVAEYEVPAELCAAQLTAFLNGLRERKLLTDIP
jgi:hypothetical protein